VTEYLTDWLTDWLPHSLTHSLHCPLSFLGRYQSVSHSSCRSFVTVLPEWFIIQLPADHLQYWRQTHNLHNDIHNRQIMWPIELQTRVQMSSTRERRLTTVTLVVWRESMIITVTDCLVLFY